MELRSSDYLSKLKNMPHQRRFIYGISSEIYYHDAPLEYSGSKYKPSLLALASEINLTRK